MSQEGRRDGGGCGVEMRDSFGEERGSEVGTKSCHCLAQNAVHFTFATGNERCGNDGSTVLF